MTTEPEIKVGDLVHILCKERTFYRVERMGSFQGIPQAKLLRVRKADGVSVVINGHTIYKTRLVPFLVKAN